MIKTTPARSAAARAVYGIGERKGGLGTYQRATEPAFPLGNAIHPRSPGVKPSVIIPAVDTAPTGTTVTSSTQPATVEKILAAPTITIPGKTSTITNKSTKGTKPVDLGTLASDIVSGITQVELARYANSNPTGTSHGTIGYPPSAVTPVLYNAPIQQPGFVDSAVNAYKAFEQTGQALGRLRKTRRRRRRRLATLSDIRDLAALKAVLGQGKAFETWIATHSRL